MHISFIAPESENGTEYINLHNHNNCSYNSYNSPAKVSISIILHCSYRDRCFGS